MIRRMLFALGVPMALLAACSLPTDDRAAVYDPDDLPPEIANTTTTTTTTTMPPTTSTVPTTVDASTPAELTTTTTLPPTLTSPVDIFYTIGFSDDLSRLRVELNEDASVNQVLQQLEAPSPEVARFGLRSAVRNGMVLTGQVVVDRSTATVPLDAAVVDDLSETVLRRAIAQIVLTLSSFRIPGGGAIGSVRFEVDGEPFPVFVPALGGTGDSDEPLFFDDFAPLIDTTAGPPTSTTSSTTTSTTTTTTQPVDTTPDDTAG